VTPERFGTLAVAYGGTIARWPTAEQDAARAWLLARPEAHAVLAAEDGLDAALAGWVVPGPGAALAGRIASSEPGWHARARQMRLWLSGIGTVATLAAGIAAGAWIVGSRVPAADARPGRLYQLTVLGCPARPWRAASRAAAPVTRSPLWRALAASLLANVFAAGAIGGGLVMLSYQNTVRPAAAALRPIRAAGDGLPPATRDRFRAAMRQVVADADGLIRTAREGRETAARLFIQAQFDRGLRTPRSAVPATLMSSSAAGWKRRRWSSPRDCQPTSASCWRKA